MKRSIERAIAEYMRMFKRHPKKYQLWVSDYVQIREMSEGYYECVANGMMAGFVIGYRAARRDQKEGRR